MSVAIAASSKSILASLLGVAGGRVRNCVRGTIAAAGYYASMPRYFFDLHEADGVELDEVGMELVDHAAAERRAIHMMGSIAADYHVPGEAERFSLFVRVDKRKVFSVRLDLEVIRDQ